MRGQRERKALAERRRVVVAMSGGVDSSVAAGLLVQDGYEVVGVTLQLWPANRPQDKESGCCSLSAVEDARRVAASLGIPHYVLNFREHFASTVIADFTREYLAGRTPNPCVRCNQWIKFDLLLEKARALGADYVATGHYARVEYDETRGRWVLKRGVDPAKDQSYALHQMTQDQLARCLFPLGSYSKDRTRAMARKMAPLVAAKPDSQEICFVPDNDYAAFLTETVPEASRPGSIVNAAGEKVGEHQGIAFYTIGQRKRLGLSSPTPLYVTRLDPERNRVVVGSQEDLLARRLTAVGFNAITLGSPEEPIRVSAKIRYSMRDEPASLSALPPGPAGGAAWSRVEVLFDEPQRAITPGQSVVCYNGDLVVGGGTIEAVG